MHRENIKDMKGDQSGGDTETAATIDRIDIYAPHVAPKQSK